MPSGQVYLIAVFFSVLYVQIRNTCVSLFLVGSLSNPQIFSINAHFSLIVDWNENKNAHFVLTSKDRGEQNIFDFDMLILAWLQLSQHGWTSLFSLDFKINWDQSWHNSGNSTIQNFKTVERNQLSGPFHLAVTFICLILSGNYIFSAKEL